MSEENAIVLYDPEQAKKSQKEYEARQAKKTSKSSGSGFGEKVKSAFSS